LELKKRMAEFEAETQRSLNSLAQLRPNIAAIKQDLVETNTYLKNDMQKVMRKSSEALNDGLANAQTIQQLLNVLVGSAKDGNSHLAHSLVAHETSLQQATVRASNEVNALMAIVAAAASSSASLQQQMVCNCSVILA